MIRILRMILIIIMIIMTMIMVTTMPTITGLTSRWGSDEVDEGLLRIVFMKMWRDVTLSFSPGGHRQWWWWWWSLWWRWQWLYPSVQVDTVTDGGLLLLQISVRQENPMFTELLVRSRCQRWWWWWWCERWLQGLNWTKEINLCISP